MEKKARISLSEQKSFLFERKFLSERGLYVVIILMTFLTFLLLLTINCKNFGDGDEKSTELNQWLLFGKKLIEASSDGDIEALVDLSWTDLDELDKFLGEIEAASKARKESARLEILKPENVDKEKVMLATRGAIEVFLRSYEDLFNGEIATIVTAVPKLMDFEDLGYDPCGVIIWVKKGNSFHGIKIELVVKTSSGLKICDWIGHEGYPPQPGATLWTKRAILESPDIDSCGFPETIQYKYVYK